MTSIWVTDGTRWKLMAPTGFDAERTLHELVAESPELLPLAGAPRLMVLGSEVPLGGGYADIVAVEPTGRLVVIEVKLASNAEARRAVVAQILAYAAVLRETTQETLENEILRTSLRARGHGTIAALVEAEDPDGSFDAAAFDAGLRDSLGAGKFRLVLVLDDAPTELIRLVGYLQSVAPELVIDLVAVAAYEVNGTRMLVPQRVDSDRPTRASEPQSPPKPKSSGHLIPPEEFEAGIAEAPAAEQTKLRRLYDWARELEERGLVNLLAYRGSTGRTTLLPYVPGDEAGLVTIWNDGVCWISFWRGVFERRAPASIERIEELLAPAKLGRGNSTKAVSDELLAALTLAYEEAGS